MKRTLWTAASVLALAVTIPMMAQAQQGRGGRGPGPGMGPGGRGGPHGPGGPPAGAVLHQLNLSDEQRQQIHALAEERREARPGANMRELQQQLQAAVFADTPDLSKIEQLKTAIASAEAALLSQRIDHELRIAQILTPEQRAKARDLIATGPPAGRGRRGQ